MTILLIDPLSNTKGGFLQGIPSLHYHLIKTGYWKIKKERKESATLSHQKMQSFPEERGACKRVRFGLRLRQYLPNEGSLAGRKPPSRLEPRTYRLRGWTVDFPAEVLVKIEQDPLQTLRVT